MRRTIRFPLLPTQEQQCILLETMQQYTACFNKVATYGWDKGEKNRVGLHKATYYPLRADFPKLPSQLVISATARAAEAVKSAMTWKVKREKSFAIRAAKARVQMRPTPKFKPVRCPQSTICAIRYDQRSYTIRGDHISLATIQGRQVIALHLYPYAIRLLEKSVAYDSSDLIYRKGQFWLHMVVTLPDVEFRPNGEIVGVDFGITRPAVASNNRFFGQRRWKATECRYFRLKRALQSKGTKSAKRHLKKLSRRTARFRTNCDHIVSRQLIQSIIPGTLIVIENLNEIRSTTNQRSKQQKRAIHQWSFDRLRDLLVYKAEERGCRVIGVDPHYTSQACSRCRYIHRSNRLTQSRFRCQNCGFELNADLNSSRNIAEKHLANVGIADAGRLMSTSLS